MDEIEEIHFLVDTWLSILGAEKAVKLINCVWDIYDMRCVPPRLLPAIRVSRKFNYWYETICTYVTFAPNGREYVLHFRSSSFQMLRWVRK